MRAGRFAFEGRSVTYSATGPTPTICYHEAGHAVMALHLGVQKLLRVRLTPTDPARGGVCEFGASAPTPRAGILSACAGHAAEAVLAGREPSRRSGRDDQRAFELALALTGSTSAACRLVLELRAEARRILAAPHRWPAVFAVAEALHRRGELTGAEVYRVALDALK